MHHAKFLLPFQITYLDRLTYLKQAKTVDTQAMLILKAFFLVELQSNTCSSVAWRRSRRRRLLTASARQQQRQLPFSYGRRFPTKAQGKENPTSSRVAFTSLSSSFSASTTVVFVLLSVPLAVVSAALVKAKAEAGEPNLQQRFHLRPHTHTLPSATALVQSYSSATKICFLLQNQRKHLSRGRWTFRDIIQAILGLMGIMPL